MSGVTSSEATPPQPSTPIACGLGGQDQRRQVAAWTRILDHATARQTTSHGVRMTFRADAGIAAQLADLMVREHACCPFFSFRLEADGGAVSLSVAAPTEARDLLTEIFMARAATSPPTT